MREKINLYSNRVYIKQFHKLCILDTWEYSVGG